jgi:hypothetical protein
MDAATWDADIELPVEPTDHPVFESEKAQAAFASRA